jgi:hypothetical protein
VGTNPPVAVQGDGCERLPGRSPAAGRSDRPRLLCRGWGGAAGSASFAAGGEERRWAGRKRGDLDWGGGGQGRSKWREGENYVWGLECQTESSMGASAVAHLRNFSEQSLVKWYFRYPVAARSFQDSENPGILLLKSTAKSGLFGSCSGFWILNS